MPNTPPCAPKTAAKRSRSTGLVIGGLVLAVCAGAAVWLVGEDELPVVMADAATARAVAVATHAPSAALSAPVAAAPAEPDVSAAAILDEAPPAPAKGTSLKELLDDSAPNVAAKAAPKESSLKELLNAPGAALVKDTTAVAQTVAPTVALKRAPKVAPNVGPKVVTKVAPKVVPKVVPGTPVKASSHEEIAQLLETEKVKPVRVVQKPAELKKAGPKPAPVKVAAKAQRAKPAEPGAFNVIPTSKQASAKKTVKGNKEVLHDSDVALLAALVAHAKAHPTRVATKLSQCKTMLQAEANRCRARLCSTSAKGSAECKAPKTVSAASAQ